MKRWELAVVAGAHLVVLCVAAGIMSAMGRGDPGLALVMAAIVGTQTAGFLYYRRETGAAPFSVKATVGVVMSALAVGVSVLAHLAWGWINLPEVVIPIGALGTFVFPLVLFGSMRNAARQRPGP